MSNRLPARPDDAHFSTNGTQPFAAEAAAEESVDLREILGVLRRRAGLILLVVVITTGLAAAFAFTRAPRYQAMAVLRVADARRAMTGGMEEAAMERLTGSLVDPVASQIEVLRSRTLLTRAVDEGALRVMPTGFPGNAIREVSLEPDASTDTIHVRFTASGYTLQGRDGEVEGRYGEPATLGGLRITFAGQPETSSSGALAIVSRESVVRYLGTRLSARAKDRTDVVELRLEGGDPYVAQRTLNVLAKTFQQGNASRAREQSHRRRVFVEEQLAGTDSMLRQTQLALSAFRQRERVYSSRDRFMGQQRGLMDVEMRREELAAERRMYTSLLSQMSQRRGDAGEGTVRALVSTPGIAANPVVTQLYVQLTRYRSTRDSLVSGGAGRANSDPDVQRLHTLIAGVESDLADAVRSHAASVDARIAALDDLLSRGQQEILVMPELEAEEMQLAQQVATVQTVADQLRQELQRARIAEAVEVGQVEVLDFAGPAAPLPSRRPLLIMLGLVAGLGLGSGAALILEQLNTSLRRREDIERHLSVSSLGIVPSLLDDGAHRTLKLALPGRNGSVKLREPALRSDPTLVTLHNSRSSGAEAYRTLRTNLIFSQAVRQLRTVVVTSAGPAEGKSTTSANLAAAFAQQGMRVLLLDCDLRRPRLHELFGAPREPGFTQVLLGQRTLAETVQTTEVDGLHLLPAGTLPPNPSELLGSERARALLAAAAAEYDIVLVDTPPVLLASDASILGLAADGVILVLRAARTPRAAGQQAVQQLQGVGANIIGAVLNDPDSRVPQYEGNYGYGYGYGYYAYHAEGAEEAERKRRPTAALR